MLLQLALRPTEGTSVIVKFESKPPISPIAQPEQSDELTKYLSRDTLSEFVRSENGQTAQKKIWKELEEKLEAIEPGIMSKV